MKPRRLEIEGFGSFRRKRVLDFEDLQIFSITGPNGAGKSTLLDSMIFALYGETPRLSAQKRDLVSQGSNELNVLLEFSCGNDLYRVSRRFRISGTPYATIEKFKKGEWITMGEGETSVDDYIVKILRIPARAFVQSVVIPQGKFDLFLKPAKPKDRTDTLTEMFHLDVYEQMRERAYSRMQQAKNEADRMEATLQDSYRDATKEKLAALKNQRKDLKQKENERNEKASALKEQVQRIKLVVDCRIRLTKQEMTVERLNQDTNRELQRRQDLEKQLMQWQSEQAGRSGPLNAELQELGQVVQDLRLFATAVEKLEQLKRKIASVSKEEERLKTQEKHIERKAAQIEKECIELRREMNAIGYDSAVWERLKDFAGKQMHLERLREEESENQKLLDQLLSQKTMLEKELHSVNKRVPAKENEKGVKTERLRELEKAVHVEELRAAIRQGEPCPVCENEVPHYHPFSQETLDDLNKKRTTETESIATLQQEIERMKSESARAEGQWKSVEDQIEQLQRRQRRLKKETTNLELELRRAFEISQKEDVLRVLKALANDQELLRKKYLSIEKDLERKSQQNQQLSEELQTMLQQKSEKVTQKQGWEEQVVDLNEQLQDLKKNETTAEYLAGPFPVQAAVDRQQQIQQELLSIQRKEDELKGGLAQSIGQLMAFEKNRNAETELLATLQKEFAGFSDEERRSDEGLMRTVEREQENALTGIQELSRALGQLQNQIENTQQRLEEAGALKEKQVEAEGRRRLYATIEGYLKANRLQRYVVGKLLRTLVEHSNVYLKDLTENKYALAVDRKEDLIVRDLSSGGVERPVKTLSGGETFVISLALALALSSVLGEGIHVESLFLDEGFGSLDKDRLELVRDALLKLPLYNKMVGVVTHIEDFARAFPAQISVSPGAEGSDLSRVL